MLPKRKTPNKKSYSKLAVICISLLVILASVDINESAGIDGGSRYEGKKLCERKTGHRHNFIQDVHWRNNNCAIDCVMSQGVVLSYAAKDGTNCYTEDHRCLLGTCRAPGEYVKPNLELNQVEIKIISAYVEDKDLSPTAGESDVFIMVEMVKNGQPTYKDDDDICFTYIIQDNNRPRWRNFICKPMPLPTKAVLRFSAFDSDKPFNVPDRLGTAEEDLSYLMNRGPTKLTLVDWGAGGLQTRYYVEVDVSASLYEFDREEPDE